MSRDYDDQREGDVYYIRSCGKSDENYIENYKITEFCGFIRME